MNPRELEETAPSAGARPAGRPAEATEAPSAAEGTGVSGPTDVTVVRGSPSAPSVGEVPGAESFGKYELLGEVARGGMGVVYRARQHGLDRLVALKMILGTGGGDGAQRFLQEARAAAALDHPNVVPIYDIGESGGRPYFTMALIEGPNLRGFVDAGGLPPIPTVVSLFAQVVAGVAHAHRHGIVHRDLKPANVLVDKDGRPRVTDFGLAKRAAADTQLTVTGQVVGTPQYMAPEQARESKDVGPPADVYSLGAILYFLLAGRAPFQGESFTDLLVKVVSEEPEPPRAARPDVPDDLEALCLRCLAKKPEDRFPDANALLEALAPVAEQYLTPSTNLRPTPGSVGFPRPRSAASAPPVPSAPSLASATVPDVGELAARPPASATSVGLAAAPAAGEPERQVNRKPVVIGLGLVAVLLAAVVVVLAARDKKEPEVAQHAPPPANPAPSAPVRNVPVSDADQFAWPAPTADDFGLKVELDAPGKREADFGSGRFGTPVESDPSGKRKAGGKLLIPAGAAMSLRVTAGRDCRFTVWLLEPNGEVLKLFPNDDDADDRLTAGQERVIPGNNAYKMEATPTEGEGADRIRVIATTGEPPAYPPGTKNSRYAFYGSGPEREQLASAVRGVVLKKAGAAAAASPGAVSERELQFRVSK
jgi:serine/threonine protein kinase